MKQQKIEEKGRSKEDKALAKRRKEGEAEAQRAEEDYLHAHGMSTTTTNGRGTRPSADTATTAVDNHEPKKSTSHEETVISRGDTLGASPSRPHRDRTTTSELEAGRIASPGGHSDGVHEADENDPEQLLESYAQPANRPKHRLGFLGLFGKKVDTIEWCMVRPTCFYFCPFVGQRS